MTESRTIAWKQISIEAVAIILSILLAFAIDAWWTDLERSTDESESIELIQRDLTSAIVMLENHSAFSKGAAQSALDAYVALSGPGPYNHEKIHKQLMAVDRLTMKVPTAAYSDLLSTGNLRLIEDRELRDAIIQFYEGQDRAELIILSNNRNALDRMLFGAFIDDGLVYPHSETDISSININHSYSQINQYLGDQFDHLENPFWKFAPDSREWDKLRAVLLNAALSHFIGENTANIRIEEARKLLKAIDTWQHQ